MQKVADAIRNVTVAIEKALDNGRSRTVDAYDLIEVLLTVADELDPEFSPPKATTRKTRRGR